MPNAIIGNSKGKVSEAETFVPASGEKAILLSTSGKTVASRSDAPKIGDRVMISKTSGREVAHLAYGEPGSSSASVDPVKLLKLRLAYGKIIVEWTPGANNDSVHYELDTDIAPSVVYGGTVHRTFPVSVTSHSEIPFQYFTWHFVSIWGMRDGIYSSTHVTAKIFVPIEADLINAFKCYVTMPENLLQDGGFENGSGSESGWGTNCIGDPYSLAEVQSGDAARSGSYGGYVRGYQYHTDFIGAFLYQKTAINLTGATTVVYWARPVTVGSTGIPFVGISQGTTSHTTTHTLSTTGVWEKVVWDVSALGLTGLWNFSIGVADGGYYDPHSAPIYVDDISVTGTEVVGSWWLYGDDDAPPKELYRSGVTVVKSGSHHVTGYDATIRFHNGDEYCARIAYRLSDANNGIYEIYADVVENAWPAQLYFGTTFLCSNIESDHAGLTYHGYLAYSSIL